MARRTYRGVVVAGRGLGVEAMSAPETKRVLERILDFDFAPGTLNVRLLEAFDARLEDYVRWEDLAQRVPDPEVPGRRGLKYGRAIIAGKSPGVIFQGDEPDYPDHFVELISDHHLRRTLGLSDGDVIEFTVVDSREGAGGE